MSRYMLGELAFDPASSLKEGPIEKSLHIKVTETVTK